VLWTANNGHQVPTGDLLRAREAGLAGIDLVRWPEYATADIYRPVPNLRAALALYRDVPDWGAWAYRPALTADRETRSAAASAVARPEPTIERTVAQARGWLRAFTGGPPRIG